MRPRRLRLPGAVGPAAERVTGSRAPARGEVSAVRLRQRAALPRGVAAAGADLRRGRRLRPLSPGPRVPVRPGHRRIRREGRAFHRPSRRGRVSRSVRLHAGRPPGLHPPRPRRLRHGLGDVLLRAPVRLVQAAPEGGLDRSGAGRRAVWPRRRRHDSLPLPRAALPDGRLARLPSVRRQGLWLGDALPADIPSCRADRRAGVARRVRGVFRGAEVRLSRRRPGGRLVLPAALRRRPVRRRAVLEPKRLRRRPRLDAGRLPCAHDAPVGPRAVHPAVRFLRHGPGRLFAGPDLCPGRADRRLPDGLLVEPDARDEGGERVPRHVCGRTSVQGRRADRRRFSGPRSRADDDL